MRENANIYRNFTAVDAGGAIRRNSRRKTASYGTVSSEMPSDEEIDQRFYDNLNVMAKAGTYGDHLEIQAFCEAYGVDVKIYQKENGEITLEGFRAMAEKKPLVLLAYHVSYPCHLGLHHVTNESHRTMSTTPASIHSLFPIPASSTRTAILPTSTPRPPTLNSPAQVMHASNVSSACVSRSRSHEPFP